MREWNRRKSEAVWNCRGVGGAIGFWSYASVAQLVEQVTLNHRVLGSSPSRGNILDVKGQIIFERHGRILWGGRGAAPTRVGAGPRFEP